MDQVDVPGPGALSDAVFRLIFDASPVGVGLADEHGHFLAVNPSLCRLFGRPAEELLGRSSLEWTHPEDRPEHGKAGALVRAAADGIARVEKRFVRPDGEVRWAWLTFSHTHGPQGQTWTLAHVQDVTERIAAEQSLRESETALRTVATVIRRTAGGRDIRPETVRAAVDLVDADVGLLVQRDDRDAAGVTASTLGTRTSRRMLVDPAPPVDQVWQFGEPVRLDVAALTEHPLLVGPSAPLLRAALLAPVTLRGTTVAVLIVGWTRDRAPDDLDPAGLITLLADQTAVAVHQARLLAELETLANTDELSGLPNRRAWSTRLAELTEQARRTGDQLVVAFADFDRFKDFNDTHGHLVGDDLIREFARAAQRLLPRTGLMARWGGEEFALAVLIAPDVDPLPLLEQLRSAVPAGQTCSIGYAIRDESDTDEALMERADRALYRAKQCGRNRTERTG